MTTIQADRWTRALGLAAGVLALCVIALLWRDHRLAQRVDDLEGRLAALETDPVRSGSRGGGRYTGTSRRGWSDSPRMALDPDLDGGAVAESLAAPEARQMIEEVVADYSEAERDDRRARREEYINDRVTEVVESFADDQGLDDGTVEQLLALMLAATEERHALRSEMMDGEMTAEEIRAERDRVSQERDAELVEMLGDEGFEALQVAMDGLRGGPH